MRAVLSEQFFSRRHVRLRWVDARYVFFLFRVIRPKARGASSRRDELHYVIHLSKPRLRDLIYRSYNSVSIYKCLITPVRLTNTKPDPSPSPVHDLCSRLASNHKVHGREQFFFCPCNKHVRCQRKVVSAFLHPLGNEANHLSQSHKPVN